MRPSTTPFAARVLVGLAAVVLAFGGCRGGEQSSKDEAAKPPPPPIERVAGMKYYVGGPIMGADKYGRMRLKGFTGEVSAPTTRGLLIGFKRIGDRDFDYRTYINGRLVTQSTGFVEDDDTVWFKERFTYDSNGKVIARQTIQYDDDRQVMISRVEHVDPENGEVINTIDKDIPYSPPEDEDEDSFFADDEDEEEGSEEQPANDGAP